MTKAITFLDQYTTVSSKLPSFLKSGRTAHVPGSISEKSGRANIYSAVTRNLGTDTIVICDSPNYIKGFRYQMYCAAREAHARVCTVSLACLWGKRVREGYREADETAAYSDSA